MVVGCWPLLMREKAVRSGAAGRWFAVGLGVHECQPAELLISATGHCVGGAGEESTWNTKRSTTC